MGELKRTHLAKNDLDWMPRSLRAFRWAVAGGIWTGLGGGIVGLVTLSHFHFWYLGKWIATLGAGAYYAGDRSARAILRRRLVKLTQGHVDVGRLKHQADGDLVHVRGKIRARERLTGILSQVPTVYRRLVFLTERQRWVDEAAIDFQVIDHEGEAIDILVENARLIAPEPLLGKISGEERDRLSHFVQALGLGWADRSARAVEILLCEGDEVEVVGYKTRTLDPTLADRAFRETPMRATLRSGTELPLLIAPVRV